MIQSQPAFESIPTFKRPFLDDYNPSNPKPTFCPKSHYIVMKTCRAIVTIADGKVRLGKVRLCNKGFNSILYVRFIIVLEKYSKGVLLPNL